MKIAITFIPSEYKAKYGYASRDLTGKVIRRGLQFDPFEMFKE